MRESTIRKLIKSALISATGISACCFLIECEPMINQMYGERIQSQQYLEDYVAQEKEILHCTKTIQALLTDHDPVLDKRQSILGYAQKTDEGTYLLILRESSPKSGNSGNTRTMKHEVYHICAGHTDDIYQYPQTGSIIKDFFDRNLSIETTARIYSLTGMQL